VEIDTKYTEEISADFYKKGYALAYEYFSKYKDLTPYIEIAHIKLLKTGDINASN
jgi:hypothetical protein